MSIYYEEGYIDANGSTFMCALTGVQDDAVDVTGRRTIDLTPVLLDPDEINDPSFGVVYSLKSSSALARIDEIVLEVLYTDQPITPPPPPNPNTDTNSFLSVATANNGIYAIVGADGMIKRTTSAALRNSDPPDDVQFKSGDEPDGQKFNCVVWTGKFFYACGEGGTLYVCGPDAILWSLVPLNTQDDLLNMCVAKTAVGWRLLYVGSHSASFVRI